ncbi:hypothetical protein [Streptomyces sp. NPDC052721]|uniref:hypothetical protein n=1 Tax=Streptomyces sp. NPDC052721 TaxID=3154955 RepID=UPI003434669D
MLGQAVSRDFGGGVARRAADQVTSPCTGALAAADVFTVDNAYALLESQRNGAGLLDPFGIRP